MGNAATLQEVMNKVSHQLELDAQAPAPVKALSELEAFAQIDPLLAELNKHYLDAKHTRRQAVSEYGADDPMTEMAVDMEDSAWCAVQTRYMEIRAERALMAEAQKLMEEARLEELETQKKQKERAALDRFRDMEVFSRMHDKKPAFNGADLWLLLLFLFSGQEKFFRFEHPTYSFNRIAA